MSGIELTAALQASVDESAGDRAVRMLREMADERSALVDEIDAGVTIWALRYHEMRPVLVGKVDAFREAARLVEEQLRLG